MVYDLLIGFLNTFITMYKFRNAICNVQVPI